MEDEVTAAATEEAATETVTETEETATETPSQEQAAEGEAGAAEGAETPAEADAEAATAPEETETSQAALQPEWLIQGQDPPGGEEELVQSFQVFLQTEGVEPSGVMKIRGTATTANVLNSKKQVYPLEVWQDNLPRLGRLLTQNRLLGEIEHPAEGRRSLDRTCLQFTRLWQDGNEIKFEAKVLPTEPYGKNLQILIQNGVPVDISSRGKGTMKRGEWKGIQDVAIVQRGFRCDAFDAVIAGSSPGSTVTGYEIAQSSAADTSTTDGEDSSVMNELLEKMAQQLESLSARVDEMGKPAEANQDTGPTAGEERLSRQEIALNKILVRDRIASLCQEAGETLPAVWLNMYRGQLSNRNAANCEELEAYAQDALPMIQSMFEKAPKFPGHGFAVQKSKGERGPRTRAELIEEMVADQPDDLPAGDFSQSEEGETPRDCIKTPRRQLRRMLTNIATHQDQAWNGPAAFDALLRLEQGHDALDVQTWLNQTATDGAVTVGSGAAPQTTPYIFPLIRRVFPQLFATEIASVQPMDRPDGKIFFLDSYRVTSGHNETDAAGATVSNRTRQDDMALLTSSYANDPGETEQAVRMAFRLSSLAVTAVAKKLMAEWSIEEMQDLRAYHNLDAAGEAVAILAREIAMEWNQLILNDMLANATGANLTYATTAPSGYTQKEWDEYLSRYIDKAGNEIYKKRFGDPSHLICGPDAFLKLSAAFRSGVKPGSSGETFAGVSLYQFTNGGLEGLKIYKTGLWNSVNTNKILLVRRGETWSDTPYVWAPYVDYISPILTSPDVFTQKQGIMSRAARKTVVADALATVTIASGTGATV